MKSNRVVQALLILLGLGTAVALLGVLVGEFGLPGLIVGLVIAYTITWRASSVLRSRRKRERAQIQTDIATLRDRLNQDPGTPDHKPNP